jgi:hypothetical protein
VAFDTDVVYPAPKPGTQGTPGMPLWWREEYETWFDPWEVYGGCPPDEPACLTDPVGDPHRVLFFTVGFVLGALVVVAAVAVWVLPW